MGVEQGPKTMKGFLENGTPVNVWYFKGQLTTDYEDGELNGDPIYDSNNPLKRREIPDRDPSLQKRKRKN